MSIDAVVDRRWRSEAADLCIIGAGPAGLVLASELVDSGLSIVLLESGGNRIEDACQELNLGDGGHGYGDIASTRCRQIGGTIGLWNTRIGAELAAKFVPLDPVDFVARPWRTQGWPFPRAEIERYYAKAQSLAALGPFRYDSGYWQTDERMPAAQGSEVFSDAVYQFGSARPYAERMVTRLAGAENVRLVTHGTVVELESDAAGVRVEAARVAVPGDDTFRVAAKRFVLAAGAIESARLLLASNDGRGGGLGNRNGLVGRGFMEHPRDYALTLRPRPGAVPGLSFYDLHRGRDGTWIMGRLALSQEVLDGEGLPNASITLLAGYRSGRVRRIVESGRRLIGLGPGYPRGGTGWSVGGAVSPDFFRLLVNLEQAPHFDNRVCLIGQWDSLGMPRVQLSWRWSEAEQRQVERLRRLIAREVERLGLGIVTVDPRARVDPRAHHHAGTLRMHRDPEQGVVDPECRMHELENLYCTGAGVFPTAGFANPMLTIVAMAARLAKHLRGEAEAGDPLRPDSMAEEVGVEPTRHDLAPRRL